MWRRAGSPTFFLATASLLARATALFAEPVVDPSLQKVVRSAAYQRNVARLFSSLPPDVFQRCPSLVSNGSSVMVLKPSSFASDGYPISGVWKQSFRISGCGNDTSINFYFFAQPDEKITSLIAAPGETHADPTLQRDAMRYVLMAAKWRAPQCNAPHLRTTRFDGRFGPQDGSNIAPRTSSGWHETWTASACGKLLPVPLTFITDATGTRVVARVQ